MKKIFFSMVLMLFSVISFAQRAGKTLTETKNVSISTSVSISNSDNTYKLSASFDRNVSKSLSKLISERLNQPARISGSVSSWISGKVYTISLKENKLNIDLHKEHASQKLVKTIEKLGADAQKLIDGRHAEDGD